MEAFGNVGLDVLAPTCWRESRKARTTRRGSSTYHDVAPNLNNAIMSKASVEQALTGLVPALNGPLPPELVDLTLSLLARSRSVANSLKSDEEIARPYACAQLACERYWKQ